MVKGSFSEALFGILPAMTQITPSLLAAAYASITVPSAPRSAELSVIGLAAADIPPNTTADSVFPDNVSLSGTATLGGAIIESTSRASASIGVKSPATLFSSGGSTASTVLGLILDIDV